MNRNSIPMNHASVLNALQDDLYRRNMAGFCEAFKCNLVIRENETLFCEFYSQEDLFAFLMQWS